MNGTASPIHPTKLLVQPALGVVLNQASVVLDNETLNHYSVIRTLQQFLGETPLGPAMGNMLKGN